MKTKFAVSISGYQGQAATLLCVHDAKSGVLLVGSQRPFLREAPAGFALVANVRLDSADFVFGDEHLRDAIRAFFMRKSQGLIDIAEALVRFDPDNAIEQAGVDERGTRYVLNETISNGQMAVLAATAFVELQAGVSVASEMLDEMAEMYRVLSF